MEDTNDIIQRFSETLKSGEGHLSEPALSLYINFHDALSGREKTFVDNHLRQCQECSRLYERVFDDEIDLDIGHVSFVLTPAAPDGTAGAIVLNSTGQEFVLMVRKEPGSFSISFTKLPREFQRQKMRIVVNNTFLRLVSVEENKPIKVADNLLSNEHFQSVRIATIPQMAAETQKTVQPLFIRYTRYLAAAVLIVVAGAVLYENLNRHEEKPTAVETKSDVPIDSLGVANKTDLPEMKKEPQLKKMPQTVITPALADHYKPNDVLESFVDRHYRAAAVEIISPVNADTISSPIIFKWKEIESAHSFGVIIVNNKNDEVWRGTAEGFSLTCEQKLKPGLYYWMLKSDGDILSVRKFFMR
ncbi:zf-HC2 domain-containing protein [bacterium]|nr:zf-HC2 domain-containing protein [bacterium]